jgi:hypothetical protein
LGTVVASPPTHRMQNKTAEIPRPDISGLRVTDDGSFGVRVYRPPPAWLPLDLLNQALTVTIS